MDSHTDFSPLDEVIPPLYYTFILAFKSHPEAADNDGFFSILQTGLSKLVEQYPHLAAEITRNESNHLIFDQSKLPAEIPLVRKDLTEPGSAWSGSYQEMEMNGMSPGRLDAKILAPLTAGVGPPTRNLMSAQVNFIPGGTLLSVCFSHAFVDGTGAALITGEWARLCRELQQGSAGDVQERGGTCENPVVTLASKIDAKYDELKGRPELWRAIGLDASKGHDPETSAQVPVNAPAVMPESSYPAKIGTTLFSFSDPDLQNLKAQALFYIVTQKEDAAWVSTHDALIAFLWRHILRARLSSKESKDNVELSGEHSIVGIAVNGRKTLSIPQTYIGNVMFESYPSLPVAEVVSTKTSLGHLARTIRTGIRETRTGSLLTESIALASCIPSHMLPSLRWVFGNPFDNTVLTTSWVNLPFYKMDWGPEIGNEGFIDYFRVPGGQFAGVVCIQPRKRDGTVEVVVSMKEDQLARLAVDDDFLESASFIG